MDKKFDYGPKKNLSLTTWVKLTRAFHTCEKMATSHVKDFGLSYAQFSVIEALGHLGPLKIGVLCSKMLVTGGNMTLVLDSLEKVNYIERVHSKEDRRAINVQLTKKGEELFANIFPKHAEHIDEMLNGLSGEEQKELGKLLKKLGASLND